MSAQAMAMAAPPPPLPFAQQQQQQQQHPSSQPPSPLQMPPLPRMPSSLREPASEGGKEKSSRLKALFQKMLGSASAPSSTASAPTPTLTMPMSSDAATRRQPRSAGIRESLSISRSVSLVKSFREKRSRLDPAEPLTSVPQSPNPLDAPQHPPLLPLPLPLSHAQPAPAPAPAPALPALPTLPADGPGLSLPMEHTARRTNPRPARPMSLYIHSGTSSSSLASTEHPDPHLEPKALSKDDLAAAKANKRKSIRVFFLRRSMSIKGVNILPESASTNNLGESKTPEDMRSPASPMVPMSPLSPVVMDFPPPGSQPSSLDKNEKSASRRSSLFNLRRKQSSSRESLRSTRTIETIGGGQDTADLPPQHQALPSSGLRAGDFSSNSSFSPRSSSSTDVTQPPSESADEPAAHKDAPAHSDAPAHPGAADTADTSLHVPADAPKLSRQSSMVQEDIHQLREAIMNFIMKTNMITGVHFLFLLSVDGKLIPFMTDRFVRLLENREVIGRIQDITESKIFVDQDHLALAKRVVAERLAFEEDPIKREAYFDQVNFIFRNEDVLPKLSAMPNVEFLYMFSSPVSPAVTCNATTKMSSITADHSFQRLISQCLSKRQITPPSD